jgi:hypothetical protein
LFQKPVINVHWRKWTNESEGKPEQKFVGVLEQFLEVVSVFQRSKQNFIFYLSLEQGRKKI